MVLKGRYDLPARAAWKQLLKQLWCSTAIAAPLLRCELPARTTWKQLWCSNAAAGCRCLALSAASAHEIDVSDCLAAALVLKGRCRLPARAAWKQFCCAKAAAGCQSAPLRTSWPLHAATALLGIAAVVLKGRCGLPARIACKQLCALRAAKLPAAPFGAQRLLPAASCTAWKQLWCSKAAASCQHRSAAWKQLWC